MKKIILFSLIAAFLLAMFPQKAQAATLLKVSSVTFKETDEGKYTVSWKISKGSGSMNVHVFLSVSDHDYEAPSAELGSIRSGSQGSLAVTIPDVDSGYYHFMISVTTMSGTVTYAFSQDSIFYDNKAGDRPLSGITTGRNGQTVYSVWDDDSPAVLYLYDSKTKELIASEFGYEKPLSVKIPSSHTDVIAGTAAYNGTGGRFTPVECPAAGLPDVSSVFPEESITNQPEMVFTVPEEIKDCRIFRNGEECRPEDGAFVLELDEGQNDMIAFVTGEKGVTAVCEKHLELDTVPPELTIEKPGPSAVTERNTAFLQGYAEKGALVTCDNQAVAMVDDCFSIEKKLSLGSNSFSITASDKAGNATVTTVTIRRTIFSDLVKTLIIIIVIAALGILAEAYLLLYRQRRRKKND